MGYGGVGRWLGLHTAQTDCEYVLSSGLFYLSLRRLTRGVRRFTRGSRLGWERFGKVR